MSRDIVERMNDGVPDSVGDAAILMQEAADEIERLRAAIRSTASQGIYSELAVRRAVSFELAELIVTERAALEQKADGK